MGNGTRLSDAELGALLGELESDRCERKAHVDSSELKTRVREAICSFANDLPGHRKPGVVIIGARDDGIPSGTEITEQLLQTLADMRTDGKITPTPAMTVEVRILMGSPMAVVTVQPSDNTPVRFDGRICVRIGARRAIANQQDERVLNEKRRKSFRYFDIAEVPGSALSDLNLGFFSESYLPGLVSRLVLDANDRTMEQKLAAAKMVVSAENPVPTVLGMLVLGISARDFLACDYVQFLRVGGTEFGHPVSDEEEISGTILEIVRRTEEKATAHNRMAVDMTSGPIEVRSYDYPREALEQLIRNAVMHRNYEGTNAPVRVTWFDDRVEIQSPGGPYGEVTPGNIGQPGIIDCRNPNLAESMKALGLVQRYGYGLQLARQRLEANGNPPLELDAQHGHVVVTMRKRA